MGEERGKEEGWRRGAEQEEGTTGGDRSVCTEPRGVPGLWPPPYRTEAATLFSPIPLGLLGAPAWQRCHGEGLATHVPEAGKEGEERWLPLPPPQSWHAWREGEPKAAKVMSKLGSSGEGGVPVQRGQRSPNDLLLVEIKQGDALLCLLVSTPIL